MTKPIYYVADNNASDPMNKSEAEMLVMQEWRGWASANLTEKQNPTGRDGLAFFVWLQKEKPHLLEFPMKVPGDKWQIVHAWLLHRRLVAD